MRLPRGTLLGCVTIISVMVLCSQTQLAAHPGGLNAEGCHTNRRTGEYHCHRKKSPSPPARRSQATPLLGDARQDAPFASCAEARAAGAAPVRKGEPGYSPRLDRDGDGIGCE